MGNNYYCCWRLDFLFWSCTLNNIMWIQKQYNILLLLLPWLHTLVRFLITIIWVRPRYYYNNADVINSFNLYLFLDTFLKMYCFVNILYILYFWSNSCLYNNTIYTTYIVLTIYVLYLPMKYIRVMGKVLKIGIL